MTQKELEKLQDRCDNLKYWKDLAELKLKTYISENVGLGYRNSDKYLELLSSYYTMCGAYEILEAVKLELQFNVRK